jgi:pimeloyl-ACP methyl ester carboxylesterase
MIASQTHYAKSGDVSIAYQVTGSGPFDLVFVPGFVSNLDVQLELPGWSSFFSRLSNFSRLIRFDKRGTGLSDRVAGIANLEDRMDDVRAVMDALGSERAALVGVSEGGPMSLLFAATYPERVSALVLYASFARHPTLTDENFLRRQIESVDRWWGSGEFSKRNFAPNDVAVDLPLLARFERQAASPSSVAAITLSRACRKMCTSMPHFIVFNGSFQDRRLARSASGPKLT